MKRLSVQLDTVDVNNCSRQLHFSKTFHLKISHKFGRCVTKIIIYNLEWLRLKIVGHCTGTERVLKFSAVFGCLHHVASCCNLPLESTFIER